MSTTLTGTGLSPASSKRLLSLDALRGFDMFVIAGGEMIVETVHKLLEGSPPNSFTRGLDVVNTQLQHVSWEGFRFYDLIFPLFVFMTGVSLVYSLSRIQADGGRGVAMRRLLLRGLMMYLLGLWYYGGWSKGFDNVRLLGVLQRIAICYTCAGLLFLTFRTRGLVVICVLLLVGYWAALTYIPVPGVGPGNYAEGKNLANYIDQVALPLRKHDGTHDPEGLLSTLPAIAGCLLGVFAGLLMRTQRLSEIQKVLILLGAGAVLLAGGYYWGFSFPVIKKIWTSSFVLVATGWSCLLLALFHLVIDVIGFKIWAWPFIWIGVNPLIVYLSSHVTDWRALVRPLVGGPVEAACGIYGPLLVNSSAVLLLFLFVRFLYLGKIYIRV